MASSCKRHLLFSGDIGTGVKVELARLNEDHEAREARPSQSAAPTSLAHRCSQMLTGLVEKWNWRAKGQVPQSHQQPNLSISWIPQQVTHERELQEEKLAAEAKLRKSVVNLWSYEQQKSMATQLLGWKNQLVLTIYMLCDQQKTCDSGLKERAHKIQPADPAAAGTSRSTCPGKEVFGGARVQILSPKATRRGNFDRILLDLRSNPI